MRYVAIIFLSVVGLVLLTGTILNYLFLPYECILDKKEECLKKISETDNTRMIGRICHKYSEEDCIKLLSDLHSASRDSDIHLISDDYCLNRRGSFCAFSAISYSAMGNTEAARRFSASGCEQSEGVSCAILAGIQLDEENTEEALTTSLKGCLLGSAAACAISGTILFEKGNEEQGAQFIKRCCELGGDECCE